MSLKFINSQNGKKQLIHDGFVYGVHRENKNSVVWRCVKYKDCFRGMVWTSSMKRAGVIIELVDHNHGANAGHIEARKVVEKMKKHAVKSVESTKAVVANGVLSISEAAAAELPSVSCLQRTIQRERVRANPVLLNPDRIEDLELLDVPKVTNSKVDFLMHDSGGKKRFLIFSTVKNLEYLASCQRWFADGTFRSVPSIFKQLYTIHGCCNDKVIPLVYVLACSKQKRLYVSVLLKLKELEPRLNPEFVMVDFELAFIVAIEECLPETVIKGCHFHFAQSVYRHVQSSGVQTRYGIDSEFAIAVKMFISLVFVPPSDVVEAFELLIQSEYFKENENDLKHLADYFEGTWVGKIRRRKRSKPLFEIAMWNCYDAIVNNLPQTNNVIEGWHRGFNEHDSAHHAQIGKFIRCLQSEQDVTELYINQ